MANVSIRNLGVAFGKLAVLDGLSLDIAPAEFVVLLGPSGCGKSTLLNAIAGLQETTRGTIEIGGRDMTRVAPKDRGIAMVFQSYALYPRMTVAGNLGFGLRVAGVAKAEVARRVGAVAAMLQLEALLDRRPAELSGGQRQRVAIGRAVVREAPVYLFDEPLSNLDAQLRAELRLEIKRLHQRLKATMIYVTHDQVEAMTLADRIAVMKDKTIQQLGTPDEIYARPANLFVARFIGSPAMNFVDAEIRVADGAARVTIGAAEIAVPGTAARHGQLVVAGIRPEHLALAEAPTGIGGVVDVVENLGGEKLVWVRVGGRPVAVRSAAAGGVRAGDAVHLAVAAGAVHVFDRDSGRRV